MELGNSRIIRDISDGIIAVGPEGDIIEMNDASCRLLGTEENRTGQKYFTLFEGAPDERNDGFHQIFIDAVFEKEAVHRKVSPFYMPDGTKRMFEVTSSALTGDDGSADGVILSFSDRTEEHRLRMKLEDSSVIMVGILCSVCAWNFIGVIWDTTGRLFPSAFLNKLMILSLFIPVFIEWRHFHMTVKDLGLNFKGCGRAVVTDTLFTAAAVVVMIVIKLIVRAADPDFFTAGSPFFSWGCYPVYEWFTYMVMVFMQELLTRGIIHEALRSIIPAKNIALASVLVSSLLFGAMHFHMGIIYMVGAALLLGLFGILYNRQHSVWALCIPHYVLGMMLGILGFV